MRSSVVRGVMSYPDWLYRRSCPGTPGCQPLPCPPCSPPLLPLLPMPRDACEAPVVGSAEQQLQDEVGSTRGEQLSSLSKGALSSSRRTVCASSTAAAHRRQVSAASRRQRGRAGAEEGLEAPARGAAIAGGCCFSAGLRRSPARSLLDRSLRLRRACRRRPGRAADAWWVTGAGRGGAGGRERPGPLPACAAAWRRAIVWS